MLVCMAVLMAGCSKQVEPAKPLGLATPPQPQAAVPVATQPPPPPAAEPSAPVGIAAPSGSLTIAAPPPQTANAAQPVRVITVDAAFAQTQPKQTRARKSTGPQENLDALNNALRAYLAGGKPLPTQVGELVRAGMISSVPRAPAGMKFSVDAAQRQVVLTPNESAAGR